MSTADGRWAAAEAYETFMGRWSRSIARTFVEWLDPKPDAHWLEVGCGTGALTSAICRLAEPASVVACDLSEPFVRHAERRIADARVSLLVAGASDPPHREGGFDAIVSGLVLNFVDDPETAVAAMRERLRPQGIIAAYVWDYGHGMEFLRRFWDEAVALDPAAADFDEGRRFPLCQPDALENLFRSAGLSRVGTQALEIPTHFEDFDDYWEPFLGDTGPAPGYVASLGPSRRELLRERLRQLLTPKGKGPVKLVGRAWAVRGISS